MITSIIRVKNFDKTCYFFMNNGPSREESPFKILLGASPVGIASLIGRRILGITDFCGSVPVPIQIDFEFSKSIFKAFSCFNFHSVRRIRRLNQKSLIPHFLTIGIIPFARKQQQVIRQDITYHKGKCLPQSGRIRQGIGTEQKFTTFYSAA